jgi:wobble nucleotide-excising tRNase
MTTIQKIQSISKTGVFASDDCISNTDDFLKYNLIYGFNGSGKTTLSRVLCSLSLGKLHRELPEESVFRFLLADGSSVQNQNLEKLKDKFIVFNVDFVEDNFSWAEGNAKSIVYLGSAMSEAGKKLEEKKKALEKLTDDIGNIAKEIASTEKGLASYFTDLGRTIKERTKLPNYNAGNLKSDYEKFQIETHSGISLEDYQSASQKVLLSQSKPIISNIDETVLPKDLLDKAKSICLEVPDLKIVKDLVGYEDLLDWIKEGLDYHTSKSLEDCKFCGSKLTVERIVLLTKSLNNKFDRMKSELTDLLEEIGVFVDYLNKLQPQAPLSSSIYSELATDIDQSKQKYYEAIESVRNALNKLSLSLKNKSQNLKTSLDITEINVDVINAFTTLETETARLNAIIGRNNKKSEAFETEKSQAIETVIVYSLISERQTVSSKKKQLNQLNSELAEKTSKSAETSKEVENLSKEVSDHGKAADVINDLLQNYLGHSELSLSLNETGYLILRHGKPLCGPISEGEKTAISLCYFISKLNEDGKSPQSSIVVLDDPISSLDTKARSYASNLLQSHLNDSGQLFILTHNLHFMNECKKWLRGRTRSKTNTGQPKEPTARFYFLEALLDEKINRRVSKLCALPKLLSEYDTEYHFLFSQVLNTSRETEHLKLHFYYTLPNVMRRILETFFAFKIPRSQNFTDCFNHRSIADCKVDKVKLESLRRLIEFESHSDNTENLTSLSSLSVEEIKVAAITTMDLIKELDPSHFGEMEKKCNKAG